MSFNLGDKIYIIQKNGKKKSVLILEHLNELEYTHFPISALVKLEGKLDKHLVFKDKQSYDKFTEKERI